MHVDKNEHYACLLVRLPVAGAMVRILLRTTTAVIAVAPRTPVPRCMVEALVLGLVTTLVRRAELAMLRRHSILHDCAVQLYKHTNERTSARK